MGITEGQVLWLKLPFGKTDEVSKVYHPYLIISVSKYSLGIIELGQMDSETEIWEAVSGKKIPVDSNNPPETVIYKSSFLQTDRKITVDYFQDITKYLDTEDTLSKDKFNKVVASYYDRRNKYGSDMFRDLHFSKEDLEQYNPYIEWLEAQKKRLFKYLGDDK